MYGNTFIANIVSMIVASQQRFSRFQVAGTIEWGQKSKPKNNRTSNNLKKSLDQKLTLKKSHAKFPSLKNYQNITQKIFNKKKTFAEQHGWDTKALPQIFGFFEYLAPTQVKPPKKAQNRKLQSPHPPPPQKKNIL